MVRVDRGVVVRVDVFMGMFLFGWRWYRIRVGDRVADGLLVVINDKADDHGLLYGELDIVAALFEVLANIV